MAKVELRDVTKAWDKAVAVKDMNLVIENGDLFHCWVPLAVVSQPLC